MQTNVFLGNADPLLGGNFRAEAQPDYDARLAELQQMQQRIEQQRQQAKQPTSAPIWDEIEHITSELSDREFAAISADKTYQDNQAAVLGILQREQARILRPIVESTADGKTALQTLLDTIKRLRKDAAKETDRSLELFTEYTQKFSDMTYSDFLKMKNAKTKKK